MAARSLNHLPLWLMDGLAQRLFRALRGHDPRPPNSVRGIGAVLPIPGTSNWRRHSAARPESDAPGPATVARKPVRHDIECVLPWELVWKREAGLFSRGPGLPGGDDLAQRPQGNPSGFTDYFVRPWFSGANCGWSWCQGIEEKHRRWAGRPIGHQNLVLNLRCLRFHPSSRAPGPRAFLWLPCAPSPSDWHQWRQMLAVVESESLVDLAPPELEGPPTSGWRAFQGAKPSG